MLMRTHAQSWMEQQFYFNLFTKRQTIEFTQPTRVNKSSRSRNQTNINYLVAQNTVQRAKTTDHLIELLLASSIESNFHTFRNYVISFQVVSQSISQRANITTPSTPASFLHFEFLAFVLAKFILFARNSSQLT